MEPVTSLADLCSVLPANASLPDQEAPGRRSAGVAVAITALYSLICAVGLLGNILVMFGVVR